MRTILKHAFINALLTALYIALIASFLFYTPALFPDDPDTVMIPIFMLSLFVFSAALTGLLVVGRPLMWYLESKKREAVLLFLWTLGFFFLITLVLFSSFVVTSSKAPSGWMATSTPEASWSYPPDFNNEYVRPNDWPPTLSIYKEAFSCMKDGTDDARAGKTEPVLVRRSTYCKTVVTGAAAGSLYRQYAYAFEVSGKRTGVFTFTAQFPQCANYESPLSEECAREQSEFDPEKLMDRIIKTVTLK